MTFHLSYKWNWMKNGSQLKLEYVDINHSKSTIHFIFWQWYLIENWLKKNSKLNYPGAKIMAKKTHDEMLAKNLIEI